MRILIINLLRLIEIGRISGLNKNDLNYAIDFLNHNEFGLCFDTIITQMYEYDLEIDSDAYNLICNIGESMNLEIESYFFMKDSVIEK
jgi:hypothetical protein